MALYQLKEAHTVEALKNPAGDYVIVEGGCISIPIPKAEFEAKYVPFANTRQG
ncbi:MAG: hypothetical protein WC294_11120 [Methanoregula sp.]|jgi:hypothetical protein